MRNFDSNSLSDINIISVSGGKDSTALYLLAIEQFGNDFLPIFADTGHEHQVTINYVKNLHHLVGGGAPPVKIVKANFKRRIDKKRQKLVDDLRTLRQLCKTNLVDIKDSKLYRRALLRARKCKWKDEPMRDLIVLKGRAPSTKAQFCTEELKLWPIFYYLMHYYPKSEFNWMMYTGIRGGESIRRSKMQPFSYNGFFDCLSVLPLLYESEQTVWDILERFQVPPNPLYAAGNARVGCYPCIHSRKIELANLPDWAWNRLEYYENETGRTWFPPNLLPGKNRLVEIREVREWAKTTRGGSQYDMFKSKPVENVPSCMSGFIECE